MRNEMITYEEIEEILNDEYMTVEGEEGYNELDNDIMVTQEDRYTLEFRKEDGTLDFTMERKDGETKFWDWRENGIKIHTDHYQPDARY